jgi:hypothetical protein
MNYIAEEYKIIYFSENHFLEVLNNLKKFQKKAKMPDYDRGVEVVLREEIENATYVLMSHDTKRDKIQWFGCFVHKLGECSCPLMFNNIDYEFKSSTKQCEEIMTIVRRLTNVKYISANLRRARLKPYKRWIKMVYNVEFLDDDNIRFYRNG